MFIYILCKNTETEAEYSNQLRAVMPHTPSNILWHTGWHKFVLFHQEFSFWQWSGIDLWKVLGCPETLGVYNIFFPYYHISYRLFAFFLKCVEEFKTLQIIWRLPDLLKPDGYFKMNKKIQSVRKGHKLKQDFFGYIFKLTFQRFLKIFRFFANYPDNLENVKSIKYLKKSFYKP